MKFNLERIEDIINLTRQLAVGLRDIAFNDNFSGFEKTITVAAGAEYQLRNELQVIPSHYISKGQTGNGLVTRGTTEWNVNHLYMVNNGAVEVTITLHFFK